MTAVDGVATFSGLTLNQAGPGGWLIATSGSLPLVVSNDFNVVPGAASQLVVTTAPPAHVSAAAAVRDRRGRRGCPGQCRHGFRRAT